MHVNLLKLNEPGIYFLGLPWLSHRGSSFIWGVWYDAKHIADHIGIQHKYLSYRDASQRQLKTDQEKNFDRRYKDSQAWKVGNTRETE